MPWWTESMEQAERISFFSLPCFGVQSFPKNGCRPTSRSRCWIVVRQVQCGYYPNSSFRVCEDEVYQFPLLVRSKAPANVCRLRNTMRRRWQGQINLYHRVSNYGSEYDIYADTFALSRSARTFAIHKNNSRTFDHITQYYIKCFWSLHNASVQP